MNKLSEKMHSFVKTLSSTERDELYRYLWSDYVRNDVREHLSRDDIGLSDEDVNAIVETVVEYYVYNGEYDCELSYWDNISNLITNAIRRLDIRIFRRPSAPRRRRRL